MSALDVLLEAVDTLDTDGLLDERARHRVAVIALAALSREVEAARSAQEFDQLSLEERVA